MKVAEISDEAGLDRLKPTWDALLRQSASNTIFLTWEWTAAWWSTYGTPGELRILTAHDNDGALRGIAPVRSQSLRRYGQAVSAMSFIGDGSNDSDYLDFIISPGFEKQVVEAFCRYWADSWKSGGVAMFNELPAASANLPFLQEAAQERALLWKETSVPCSTMPLPQSWEEYVASLRPRFRTKIRSVLRNLESRPEVRFGFCKTIEDVERMLPVLFDLHARRWAQEGKPGVFGWDLKRKFYYGLSAQLLERDWLRFSWLEWKGRILACQYGFAYGGTYSHLQEGYEPDSEHWNAGIGLRAWSIREFIRAGLKEYDFLAGVGRHKSDWGAETKQSKRILTASPRYKNALFCNGPEWEVRIRESVKNLLPEKILVVRKQRLERQNGHAAASHGEWLRKAAARCYCQLGAPALARAIRKEYQLSVAPEGRWPKLSWEKRKEATARIFCYHRVNDEGDPFFPAISTSLFEHHIRFISKHYRVVSLAGLLDNLENGSAEPMIAITFDDGYQDNYANAFPILKRYGVPATIFLATGSIDSREPLWFEQMAYGLKRTPREHLDLEIDLPRRFWLRTEGERLTAYNRIFGLLRYLPDCERRQCFGEILRQLDVHDVSALPDRMLTWDEIRTMSAQGIDFGGHTVTHPFLSKVPGEQAAWEISECKRRVEESTQRAADFFAYPNGGKEDFSPVSKDLLRRAGYRAAMTTIWGANNRSTDRMEFRRSGPWEHDRALFVSKLDWYQLVND